MPAPTDWDLIQTEADRPGTDTDSNFARALLELRSDDMGKADKVHAHSSAPVDRIVDP